jgi:glycosyltransferase involved in cell wall biosynthesis
MFGDDWQQDSRWRVMPACADMAPFAKPVQRRDVREGLRIPEDAIVFGHVGRFVEQKNHGFLIRVAEAIAKREKRARFLLVGGGDLRPRIERFIRERSLSDRFIVLAPRDDVPDLMLGAMDFFLFPSLYEGLGLALVEAQAAGLRCFASTAVPREAIAVPSLVTRLPLSDGPKRWADAILRIADTPAPISQAEALRAVRCRFDIDRSAEELVEFYRSVAS